MKIRFIWYDMWVGAYWDREKKRLYFCPLPCIVFIFGAPNYFRAGRRSERAVCKAIRLSQRVSRHDAYQLADYFKSVGDSK